MLFPNGNSVEATLEFVGIIVRLALDNAASTLLPVWTRLQLLH